MKCPKCQAENGDTAKFCTDCGTPLKIELICSRCNHVNKATARFCEECGTPLREPLTVQPVRAAAAPPSSAPTSAGPSPLPAAFANGRYQVKKFLGEGGKKKVYLAHDTVLDRDVAFALIKTEKLDAAARTRIKREVQSMGRLGDHPNVVNIYDFGDHESQPFIVLPLLSGGDVEGLIKKAPDHKLPLNQSVEIARSVCKGLEFAHAKGIIHRDIKPGNVWLNAEGVAQIGDFGLAVAVDLSRLTQAGMMVGTVSYMPPEQAMGGNVTAKADLYSLGAMLYEMVTGRPPFVGDDSVAIIGQHINTPPVSPSWHRADLPPALETLIMQLLEKDPDKRPASAKLVLQALESIRADKVTKEATKETAAPSENPLYRRVFVGREQELKQLQSAFDGAMSGQGALLMVVGEPGIGKTALTDQLATYVALRGGRTLIGHCYEEGSLSLPYLAFVEAMRSYVLDRETDDLRREMGSGASDIARIVSEVRDKLRVEPAPSQSPDEERYRLMQAVTGFLTNAASIKPLFVLLEDLHDADKGTLDMLTHVSRGLSRSRLLMVGTYRDVEVDRTHPLSSVLAELRRASNFGRVLLRGLNAGEVGRMLSSITHSTVPPGLAETVHRQTEGNPLFVQEVVRFLAEEGLMTQQDGHWRPTGGTALEMSIPEGLRDVIGKRMSLLTSDCNLLLSTASVIGREFSVDTLRAIEVVEESVFMKALKEAVQLSVLEERPQVGAVRYRFTHAFFRQTLYEEMIAPQRLKLHQQVARALEAQYSRRLDEHAAELAEHFSQSTDPADLARAVSYSEMAAKRAIGVYAYGEAVRHFEQALKIQRVLDPDDKIRQIDLLLELGNAMNLSGEPKRALDSIFPEAFSLAESANDNVRASRACTLAIVGMNYRAGYADFGTPEGARWVERADRYAAPDTSARAWADFGLTFIRIVPLMNASRVEWVGESLRQALAQGENALDLSLRLNDAEAFWFIASAFVASPIPQYGELRKRLAAQMAKRSRAGAPILALGWALLTLAEALLEWGQRNRAIETGRELKELAERTGQGNAILLSMEWQASLATIDGRLDQADAIARQVPARGEELGIPAYAALVESQLSSIYILLGDQREIERRKPLGSLSALYAAYLGQHREADMLLQKWVVERPAFGSVGDLTRISEDMNWLSTAVLSGHRKAAEMLLSKYATDATCMLAAPARVSCVPQELGAASVLLGRYDEARKYYSRAIEVCTEMKFRPGLALTRLQLAELLLDHYPAEKKSALEHLDFAIKEFREMKMQPSLERALRHKDILKA